MNAIELINLQKEFKKEAVVKNLNLNVRKGAFFGFLGPNGAGKTVTINMMVGLLKPTSGKINLLGFDIDKDEIEHKRKIGIVLDRPLFFERLTGKEYLHFVGRMYDLEKRTVESRTEELLEFFKLQGKKNKFLETYSAGMKRKISLAATLIHNPDLLILDEPFESIDAATSRLIRNNLELMVEKGATIFLTSHILEIVEKLCSEIAIINIGELIFKSSAEEIRNEIIKEGYSDLEDLFLNLVVPDKEKESLSWLE
ncbi:MAG: ABC transporter ATP-binding protein [Candidatus Aminicenantes bacterium]|nr:ABC transporter ATP-binding protein [Candidatus Aminicenantes bacterium]